MQTKLKSSESERDDEKRSPKIPKPESLEAKFRLLAMLPYDRRAKRKHSLVFGFILDWYHSKYGDALASVRHVAATIKERDPFGAGLYAGDVHAALADLVAWGYLERTTKGTGQRASRYVPVWAKLDSVRENANATDDEISVRKNANTSVRENANATGDSVRETPNEDPSTVTRPQDGVTVKDGRDCAAPLAQPASGLEAAAAETAQEGFEELWRAYDYKKKKKEARAAYAKLAPNADLHAAMVASAKMRIYFSRPGQPKVPLPGPLYSEAFWTDYHKALAGVVDPNKGAGATKTTKGTFNDLIARYYQSAGFTSKAAATQRNYKSVLEPFRSKHGDKPVTLVEPIHLDVILGDVAMRSTSSAHNLRKRLFLLFRLAVKWGFRTDNPMLLVDRVQHKSKGYETWTEDDIVKYRSRWKNGTPQRIAFEILLYTGLRRSDAVRLGPQHIEGGHINITARKTGAELSIPVHPEFQTMLETIPHRHLVFIATERGAARSEFAFTNWIIDAAKKAGLPPHRSPHGLRKAACVQLAEAGCDVLEIMAITGHTDIKEVQTYVAAANKKKAAKSAITKLHGAA